MAMDLNSEECSLLVLSLKVLINNLETTTDAGSDKVRSALDLSDKVRTHALIVDKK